MPLNIQSDIIHMLIIKTYKNTRTKILLSDGPVIIIDHSLKKLISFRSFAIFFALFVCSLSFATLVGQ